MKKMALGSRTWRYWCLIIILGLVMLGLVSRMVFLTVFDKKFLQTQGNARTMRIVNIPAYRGMILDRNDAPLAISVPVDAIWLNPEKFSATPEQITSMNAILGIDNQQFITRLQQNKNKEFMYVKRQVDPAVAAEVQALNIPGVSLQREFRRFYPEGEVTAQLLGFTNVDDQGQEGIELLYNNWLSGVPGKKRVLRDRLGNIVANVAILREPTPGKNLILSIDRRIQYVAYVALKAMVTKSEAQAGSVVVLDAHTGEVLAMANVPSYNPNNRPAQNTGQFRNRAVTDVFEPGSTTKAFTIVNAFTSGLYNPDSVVDTAPGYIYVDGKRVDDDGHNNGKIDIVTIIQRSSNVGAAKITLSLPPKSLPTLLDLVGYGHLTNSNFPGEVAGYLPHPYEWRPFALATLSFGYGLSVTTLQLAAAYGILAADGVKYPVSLLKLDKPTQGQQILAPQIAKEVVQVLQGVVERGGTGVSAQVPGYHVAGKTGTARIVGPNGYEANHHNAIFVGMAPASNPQLVVAVFVSDPQKGSYYGGDVAAPVFSKVMGAALRILDIPPDRLANTTTQSGQGGKQP